MSSWLSKYFDFLLHIFMSFLEIIYFFCNSDVQSGDLCTCAHFRMHNQEFEQMIKDKMLT